MANIIIIYGKKSDNEINESGKTNNKVIVWRKVMLEKNTSCFAFSRSKCV
jgi:hypothetical protein